MSDDRLRELERAFRASGALEDEVGWLQERRRAGLDALRLRAAAALGHEAAAQVTGLRIDVPPTAVRHALREPLEALWGELLAVSVEAAMRAALAYARALRSRLREEGSQGDEFDAQVRTGSQCVDAGVSWVLRPTAVAAGALEADVGRVRDGWTTHIIIGARELTERLRLFGALVRGLPTLLTGRAAFLGPETAAHLEAMRADMRAEVVPWLLDPEDDPLRDDLTRRLESVSRIDLATPCDARWEEMAPTDDPRARRCGRCAQDVLDLKALTLEEAEAVVHARERGERVCVRLFRRADGSVLLRDCPIGLDGALPPHFDRGPLWIG